MAELPQPFTNRTADDVKADPRPGDTFIRTDYRPPDQRYTVIEDGLCQSMHGTTWRALPMLRPKAAVPTPRCIATDPRPGDTCRRNHHHEEVMRADGIHVCTIDQDGNTYTYPWAAWAADARTWTSCKDRAGGARFDPQVGDEIQTRVGCSRVIIRERSATHVGYIVIDVDYVPGPIVPVACPVEYATLATWASQTDGVFSIKYVRQTPREGEL